jgi:myosin heavy subunit
MGKIYYRAGKPDKKVDPNGGKVGKIQAIATYIAKDPTRIEFEQKLTNDPAFRKELGWTKKPVEVYLEEWHNRAKTGGMFVPEPDHKNEKGVSDGLMCTNLYLVGEQMDMGEKQIKIKTEEGKEILFDRKTETCVYNKSHDGPVIPDDVVAIDGFGEASLLKVMKRRLSERLNIYTYVGDVVLCVNPYMFIPNMVLIAEYPAQKNYQRGIEPNAYATAHFAYWGIRDPDQFNSQTAIEKGITNQSCPVSGESGAGKTVACGFIMKYLAKLSGWRMKELGEVAEEGAKDITKLIAGVSPFLEAFGNGKTTMNDNSSRFGKFTKIYIEDGKITGAGMEKYLLEKARLTSQGQHERNYHVFYGLLWGCTPEEKDKYKFEDTDARKFRMLVIGNTPMIEHEINKDGSYSYDLDRMNNDLHPDPDDTGYRAAFTAANVDKERQSKIWDCIAAIMKLGNVMFEKDPDKKDGSRVISSIKMDLRTDCFEKTPPKVEGSITVDGNALCAEVDELLGTKALGCATQLIFYRMILSGKNLDCPQPVSGCNDNRNALQKTLYGNMFNWLFDSVANEVLAPEGGASDTMAFCGLLDIFGFEVFKKIPSSSCVLTLRTKSCSIFSTITFSVQKLRHTSHKASIRVPYRH